MQLEAIISTLLAAAAFLKKPIQDAAGQSIKDLFDAIRYYLKKQLGKDSDGAKVLDLAVEKPESAMRTAVLAEEMRAAGLSDDDELVRLAEKLAALLPPELESVRQLVRVNGHANKVLVAGRDVVTAERVIHRNAIMPDERHLTAVQRSQIRALIAELATRLAGDSGRPNFAAGHRMLQRKLGVLSYALIPYGQFEEAIRFLKQRCAINRLRSRQRCVTKG